MCDDMISTAGTMCSAAKLVKDRGAKSIIVGASHGVFAGSAIERLKSAPFDEIIVTDTIPQTAQNEIPNMKVLSIAKLLGEAIKRTHRNKSISSMFQK